MIGTISMHSEQIYCHLKQIYFIAITFDPQLQTVLENFQLENFHIH